MPKFLVNQVLPEGGDLVRDHLEPRAAELASQLVDASSVEVTWLWGCADVDRNEWHMLYEAADEATMATFVAAFPGVQSVTRVLHVTPDNLAWALVSGIADGKRRREAGEDGDGDVRPWAEPAAIERRQP